MSTDYGYACRTCGRDGEERHVAHVVIDNCREPEILQSWLVGDCDLLEALRLVAEHTHWYGLLSALELVVEHRALGHEVVVIDEYHRQFDRCHKRRRCGGCGREREQCEHEPNHEGDCALADGRSWSDKEDERMRQLLTSYYQIYREALALVANPALPQLDGLRAAVEAHQDATSNRSTKRS